VIDPINTTDGTACALCGEEACQEQSIVGRLYPIPVCAVCAEEQVTTCPDCQRDLLVEDGERVYHTASLYCADCATQVNVAAAVSALRADMARDDAQKG
jgi:hypothetical protein